MQISPGSTDRTILVYARDTLTGLGKTGLVAASINAQYTRAETDNDVTIAAVTEANLTALTDAHSDGGWFPVDATNAPGLYRFDLPDAVCASGAWEAVVTIIDAGSNNFEIAPTRIELVTAGSGPTAAEVADAVWDEDATAHQTQGTFGQAIGDPAADTNTIYKAVVTDATGATVGVDVVAIKAETASILTDTAEIGAAGAGLTNINLPDQTMNITGNITGNLSGSVGSVTGLTAADVAAIKAKTDSLVFTVANQVDANVQYVNDVAVGGTGADGDEWGPA